MQQVTAIVIACTALLGLAALGLTLLAGRRVPANPIEEGTQ